MKAVLAMLMALALAGCHSKSTEEFGTEQPRMVWDNAGHAWVVRHNIGNTFLIDRLPAADRDGKTTTQ